MKFFWPKKKTSIFVFYSELLRFEILWTFDSFIHIFRNFGQNLAQFCWYNLKYVKIFNGRVLLLPLEIEQRCWIVWLDSLWLKKILKRLEIFFSSKCHNVCFLGQNCSSLLEKETSKLQKTSLLNHWYSLRKPQNINELNNWHRYIANCFIDFQINFQKIYILELFLLFLFLYFTFSVIFLFNLILILKDLVNFCWTKQYFFCWLNVLTDVLRALKACFRNIFWVSDTIQSLCSVF